MSVNQKMTAIADAIRNIVTSIQHKLTLDDIANFGIQKVYDEGYHDGFYEGRQYGIEYGKRAEWNAFWDEYQMYGQRTYYPYAFANRGWSDKTFYPKYNITVKNACDGLFSMFGLSTQGVADKIPAMDLTQRLEECGVTLTFENISSAYRLFYYAQISSVPEIDLSTATNVGHLFLSSEVETIDKLILNSDITSYSSSFGFCKNLKNIVVEGYFSGSVSFASSPLTTKSIVNIIEHLNPNSQGQTLTLLRTAVNNMVFPFTSEESGRTYNSFEELVGSTGWSISLV